MGLWILLPTSTWGQEAPLQTDVPFWFPQTFRTLSIAIGDVDNDGDLDLVAGNFDDHTAIYYNADGAFDQLPLLVGPDSNQTRSVTLGDVDGDGDLDLVLGEDNVGSKLYLNSTGTFESTHVWSAGDGDDTWSVSLGDIDNDGDLDLVCGNNGQPTRLYRNSDGRFENIATWSTEANWNTNSVALGDVDGNGYLDIVCGNLGQQTTLYLNVGGTLSTTPDWLSNQPQNARSVALGDVVNRDGRVDLVCGNYLGPATLFENLGRVFGTAPAWMSDDSSRTTSVALGDADADGDLDLVAANEGNSRNTDQYSTLYLNVGNGLQTYPAWFSKQADATQSVAWADVDSDGDLDVICGNFEKSSTLYRNRSVPFRSDPHPFSGHTDRTQSLALGDLNRDGSLDLVCGNDGQSTTMYLNPWDEFRAQPSWASQLAMRTRSVALGDLDGDEDLDLVCGNEDQQVTLYLNSGTSFDSIPSCFLGQAARTQSVALGDVDQDGDLDVVRGNWGSPTTLHLNSMATDSLAWCDAPPAWQTGRSDQTRAVALGDVDGNGVIDLVCGNQNQSTTLYLNPWDTPNAKPSWSSSRMDPTYSVALGDINGDGQLDLVCGNVAQSSTLYLGSNGRFEVTPCWFSGQADQTRSVALDDVDGDGDLDLICGNQGRNTLYLNTGGCFENSPAWSSRDEQTLAVALGDVDSDGDVDLVCGNGQSTNALLRNGRLPLYKGVPSSPEHHLPNNGAFIRHVRVFPGATTYRVRLTAFDVEDDPIRLLAGYQFKGSPDWYPLVIAGNPDNSIHVETSRNGIEHEFVWDVLGFPRDQREVVLRLRAISNPARVGLIQNVAPYMAAVGRIVPQRPRIATDVDTLYLPAVTVGDRTETEFSILNIGNDTLTINAFQLPSADMSMSAVAPIALPPGEAHPLRVVFDTRRPEDISMPLQIASDDPTTPLLEIPLHSTVRALGFSVVSPYPTGVIAQGEPLTISVAMRESTESDSASMSFRWAGQSQTRFRDIPMAPSSQRDQYTASIPGDSIPPRGIEYYVTVYNGTAKVDSDTTHLQVRVTSHKFPSMQPSLRYRIVSMPFQTTATALGYFADDLGEVDNTSWRMFAYESADSAYSELTNDNLFPLQQGRAYWLIVRESVLLDVEPLDGLTAPSDRAYSIALDRGWNMIGNPFNFPVAFDSVDRPQQVRLPQAYQDTSYVDATILSPFEGYFIHNASAQPETLRIHPREASFEQMARSVLPVAGSCRTPSENGGWWIELTASTARGRDAANVVGVHPEASDVYDTLDRAKPPPPPDASVRLALVNRGWDQGAGLYRTDVRALDTQGHTWNIEVTSRDVGEEVTLTGWLRSQLPVNLELRLIDMEQQVSVDLLDAGSSHYTLLSHGSERPYRLVLAAGTDEYVGDHSPVAVPEVVTLEQNTPNPFNPSTRIRFGLPEAATVTLEIYNARGEKIAALLSGKRMPEGFHVVVWNGDNSHGLRVASGVYFYRLNTSGQVLTQKMLVMK